MIGMGDFEKQIDRRVNISFMMSPATPVVPTFLRTNVSKIAFLSILQMRHFCLQV